MRARTACEHCGAPLRGWKHRAGTPSSFRADLLEVVPTADGRLPTVGAHGCNAFCSVRCGFDWAVRYLRAQAADARPQARLERGDP